MSRCSHPGVPAQLAHGAAVFLLCAAILVTSPAHARAAARAAHPRTALAGFVKDRALARLLGETLFRDTLDVMSDSSISPPAVIPSSGPPDQSRDNSVAGRVARTVLAHRSLDKYLWLIRHAYGDSLWRRGDRARIEQHFPLIWRTSIMLYEATLNATPHRVRVCTPADNGDGFDCRDEAERATIVPIPSRAPLIGSPHQPVTG